MIITNKVNLPAPFVRMAQSDYTPTPKRYSATTLLKPVREILLKRRHDSVIEQDCADMIWLLFGQAVHLILEKYGTGKSEFTEERLSYTFPEGEGVIGGYTVSGIIDLYDMAKEEVVDYKTATVWKVIYRDFVDWKKQGLIYAWLCWKNGLPVKRVKMYAILKDYNMRDSKIKAQYPKLPVVEVKINVTQGRLEATEKYIRDKLAEIVKYEDVPDGRLPLCPPEDRWNDGDKYAVKRKGREKALRVLDSLEEAEAYKEEFGGDYIEVRPGTDRKCIDYCQCCKQCEYWYSLREAG